MAVDPLNRVAIRLVGRAWQLRNKPDSTLKYLILADSGLTVDLTVTSFLAETEGATLAALGGAVQATRTVEIPAISGGTSHELEVRAPGKGIVAWRYRLG